MLKDYLGPAAEHKHKADEAIKENRFDDAWRHLNEQKINYYRHAAQCNFTEKQTLGLDAIVHITMGNLLRKEGKHLQALYHIAYVYKVGKLESPLNDSNDDRLRIYYKRAMKDDGFENFKQGLELLPSYDYQSVQKFSSSLLNSKCMTPIEPTTNKSSEINKEEINNRFLAERKAKKKEEHIGIPPPLKKPEKKQAIGFEKTNNLIKTTSTETKPNIEKRTGMGSGFAITVICVVMGLILLLWLLS
ncbi:hypothetical protein [Acinetobacter lactucae]|uniref:hypothetical protein n=1 Tax=Acinetobacter lactucae TaxID=1785128 RepID=UPI0003DF9C3A|nr:hypothetical protein [Acinetobacter lactucae]ETR94471.1 hypothetical protein M211_2185 [Acinetobacter lactucae]